MFRKYMGKPSLHGELRLRRHNSRLIDGETERVSLLFVDLMLTC